MTLLLTFSRFKHIPYGDVWTVTCVVLLQTTHDGNLNKIKRWKERDETRGKSSLIDVDQPRRGNGRNRKNRKRKFNKLDSMTELLRLSKLDQHNRQHPQGKKNSSRAKNSPRRLSQTC